MKTFRVAFEELSEVFIDAENVDEAREKFLEGQYNNPQFLGINMIDIEQE